MLLRTIVRWGVRARASILQLSAGLRVRSFAAMQCALVAACTLLLATSASAQVQYYYDELGRLVQAVAPNGTSVQYGYDVSVRPTHLEAA